MTGQAAAARLDSERIVPFAFRPDLFGPADTFERQVTQLIERIKATPRRPGIDEICIPSERAFRSRERALREGLEIDRVVFDALVALRARGKDSAGGGVSSEPFG
jgi:LDH2 family malate/lactate/ureidoglycolate dehydrogenase